MQKGFGITYLIIGILIAALVGSGIFIYKQRTEKSKIFNDEYDTPIFVPSKSPEPNNKPAVEGKACGGFAGEKGDRACPQGYYCKYPEPIHLDASGKCIKI